MTDPNDFRDIAQAGKDRDPSWYRVHRRLSIHITAALLRTSVKLDHVTYAMMLLGLLAAALLVSPSLWMNALGVLAGYASFLLDKVDGEIARVRRQQSVRGILLDRFHHRLVEPLVFLAVGLRAWQATDSLVPVIAALATMLAANIIEETQQLPAFIAAKHARELRSWPVSRRVPTAVVERVAGGMRALKTFRMYLTVLPLVMLAVIAEAWTGRNITTAFLLTSAVGLWAYTLFQAWYYTNGQLDAEIASITRQLPPLPPLPAREELPSETRAVPAEAAAAPATESRHAGPAGVTAIGTLLLALVAGSASASIYFVDQSHPLASPSGPGTESTPYNTIAAAVAARAAAGNTILVKPGTYREQISVPVSGTSVAPFVLRATGPGVVVDGADDFSSTSKWASNVGSVYLAASVNWAPKQVIVDGVRLSATTAVISAMPEQTFRHVPGQGLYVNLGGSNPGDEQTFVGRRNSAFVLSARSWVTIDGFRVLRADDRAFSLTSGSNDAQILNNDISWSLKYGVYVSDCQRVRIANNRSHDNANHGLMLTVGASGCIVEDNESYRNAVPGQRSANGLYMYGATSNVIRRNNWHDNQDSGHHMQAGANDNVCSNNISWKNGDHGYDHLGATGTLRLNDVAWGNLMDGFSIEGLATGTRLYNCIATENGLTTNEYNLWVDAGSTVGFQSNDNLFWNSTSQVPIRIGPTPYAAMTAYVAATGHDTRSVQADPRFVAPATGDFHLQASSPAIDNANSNDPNWPSTDRIGMPRSDTPGVANTGLGPVTWSDRGAHEFQPSGLPPVAALVATPAAGTAPLNVTLNASGSTDPDGSVVSYLFDFGDGVTAGPQPGATAPHVYAAGAWQASVTVTDNLGLSNSKSVIITAAGHVDVPPVATALASTQVAENAQLTLNVSVSDPDGDAITSLTADVSGLPAGHNSVFIPGAGNTSGSLTWTPSFSHAGSYTVRFFAANALLDTATTLITVTNTDRAPVVTAPTTASIAGGLQGTVGVTVSDPDGDPISSLTANLSGLPQGHTAVFTPGSGNSTGVLIWTPTTADVGSYPVSFTASNALSGQATTQLAVTQTNQAPTASLAATPLTGSAPLNVTFSGSGSSDPEGGGLTFRFEFGDGAELGPQSLAVTSHAYAAGTYTARLTVTDPGGLTSTSTVAIIVTESVLGPNLATNPSFESNLTGWNQYSGSTLVRVAGGHDGAWAVQATSTNTTTTSFGINDSPNWVANSGAVGARFRFTAWVRSTGSTGVTKLQVREYQGSTKLGSTTYSVPVTLSPLWQMLTVDHVTMGMGTSLDFQVFETPTFVGDSFLVDDVSIRLVPATGPASAAWRQYESQAGESVGLDFGARIVPTVIQANAMLRFTTTRRGPVQVDLFDALGRRVRRLLDEQDMAAGVHTRQFDGRSDRGDRLESGVYFYRVQAAERSAVGRFVLTH